ncbi:hypothetical protein, partial [Photobacterium leiognathi]|uniref:hypothetical protein n=1 Tax=Photobacterium leiognathi TaxID=553611 RepID=UPI0005B915E9
DTENLNEVNQQVDEQSLIAVDSIQTMLDSLNMIRVYAQDRSQQAPGVTDYQIAGVQDVTEENLSDINQQVNEQSLLSVNAMRDLSASLNTIRAFAVDGTLTSPSVDDYQLAGITAVNDDNLAEINQQVDQQSLNVVDDIRTMAASLNIIRAFAADNTELEPTIDDYALAGISGVDELNLAEINQQVDEQSLNVVNDIRTMAASLNRIRAFAQDDSQPVPDENDYAIAGVSGVDLDNLSEINQEVAAQSLITVNAMRALTQSLNVIRAFAGGDDQDVPSTEDYRIIGITGITDDNLAQINQQVGEQTLQTVNGVQTVLDSLNIIRAYALDNTLDAPTTDDYRIIGMQAVTEDNLVDINQQVNEQSLLTVDLMRALTTSLNIIRAYAVDNAQQAPSDADYLTVGVSDVTEENLADINQQVDEQGLQSVNDIRTLIGGINTIRAYASDNTQAEPTPEDYALAGISGVDELNVEQINQQVDEQSLNVVDDIRTMTASLNRIRTFAQDADQPVPDENDYAIAGVSGVDADNLSEINQEVAAQSLITVDGIRSLTQSMNVIRNYAVDNIQDKPTVLDYLTIGITAITEENLAEINQQVDEQTLQSMNGVQTVLDSLNTIRSYAIDNNQEIPELNDYQVAGVNGVTDENLTDINQQVDEQSLLAVDEIRTLTDSINTIRAYAEGNSLDAPTVDDYQIAGVQDVTDENLTDINQQVGVDEQSLATVNEIRTLTGSINTIRAYAEG